MNLKTVCYNKQYRNQLVKFCEKSINEKRLSKNNMIPDSNIKGTLLWLLENTKRFDPENGQFHIVLDLNNNEIIAASGVYISDFSKSVAILGVRTYVLPQGRHQRLTEFYLLPIQKQWAIEKNCKVLALSFNDYNKSLASAFKRSRLGDNRKPYKLDQLFYNGIVELEFPVEIKKTKQWVIYEKLSDWDFDWCKIKYINESLT